MVFCGNGLHVLQLLTGYLEGSWRRMLLLRARRTICAFICRYRENVTEGPISHTAFKKDVTHAILVLPLDTVLCFNVINVRVMLIKSILLESRAFVEFTYGLRLNSRICIFLKS